MKGKTFETDLYCPTCQYHFELSSGVNHDESPSDGSLSICIRCATPSVYLGIEEGRMSLRPLTPQEWEEIVEIEEIAKTRAGVLWVQAVGKK